MPSIEKMLDEVEARMGADKPPAFELSRFLFPKQLPFGLDHSRQQTAVCTRRAGKTFGCAAKLLDAALSKPGSTALYITLSRINARRIVWATIKELNREHGLGGVIGETDLCISFPNGSRVFLSGASDETEIEKFRGLALSVVVVDEAQSFPAYLQKLVDEVLAPALMDYAGSIVLVGTPGAVPVGYYHDCVFASGWTHHEWTVFDNPHIERKSGRKPLDLLDDELKRRGVTREDPVIQREWFAKWCLDSNSLVFKYDAARNGQVHPLPDMRDYVLGVDLGFDDADAIAVLGWGPKSPGLFLVEESVIPKQNISALTEKLEALYKKYSPQAVVCDMGGLGKKIAEEITSRPPHLPLEAAEKTDKNANIELLNDAMRTGRFFAPKDSRFAQDCMLVEWDKSSPERWKISERFHSDICDAVLYAYRRAQHWLYEAPKKPPPATNSPEWLEAEQAKVEEGFAEQMERNRQEQRGEAFGAEDPLAWI